MSGRRQMSKKRNRPRRPILRVGMLLREMRIEWIEKRPLAEASSR